MEARKVTIIGVVCSLAVSGCSATIKSQRIDPDSWKVQGEVVKGIVHYSPALMKVTYEFTMRVDKDGNIVTGECKRMTQKEEVQVLPDFGRPVALLNQPATLANSKFAATMSNGLLQSVNSETTSVAAELLSAVASVGEVAVAAVPAAGFGNACNSAPQITKVSRLPVSN